MDKVFKFLIDFGGEAIVAGLDDFVDEVEFVRFMRFFEMLSNLFVEFSDGLSQLGMEMVLDMIVGPDSSKKVPARKLL